MLDPARRVDYTLCKDGGSAWTGGSVLFDVRVIIKVTLMSAIDSLKSLSAIVICLIAGGEVQGGVVLLSYNPALFPHVSCDFSRGAVAIRTQNRRHTSYLR